MGRFRKVVCAGMVVIGLASGSACAPQPQYVPKTQEQIYDDGTLALIGIWLLCAIWHPACEGFGDPGAVPTTAPPAMP